MTVRTPYICLGCSRRLTSTEKAETCEAYPVGIPADILAGADHRQPRGDELDGLFFSPNEIGQEVIKVWEKFRNATQQV